MGPPGEWCGFCFFYHLSQEFFFALFLSLVTLVHAHFEPCLTLEVSAIPACLLNEGCIGHLGIV